MDNEGKAYTARLEGMLQGLETAANGATATYTVAYHQAQKIVHDIDWILGQLNPEPLDAISLKAGDIKRQLARITGD